MNREAAVKKIQKCLSLAKSSEPHEAAAAMRQAQKLIEQFGVDHPEMMAESASKDWSRSSATVKPPAYEVRLANMVAEAFGCYLIFDSKRNSSGVLQGGYTFIGTMSSQTVAAYSFTVLRRKLSSARADYSKTALRRYRKNKTAAADLFCEGWVRAVQRLVSKASPDAEREQAVLAYKELHYSSLGTLKETRRELSANVKHRADEHKIVGWLKGHEEELNNGVGNRHQELIGV